MSRFKYTAISIFLLFGLLGNSVVYACDSTKDGKIVGAAVGAAAGGVTGVIVGSSTAISFTVLGASTACGPFAPLCFIGAGIIGGMVIGGTIDGINCSYPQK
jgi:hypothetical protein